MAVHYFYVQAFSFHLGHNYGVDDVAIHTGCMLLSNGTVA